MIILNCPNCAKEFKFKDEHSGRKFACTECGNECRIPTLQELQQTWAIAVANSEPAGVTPTPPPPKRPVKTLASPPKEPAEPPTPPPLVHDGLNVTSSPPDFYQRLFKRGVSWASAMWQNSKPMVFGVVLIVVGGIGLLYFLNMDTTVFTLSGRVHNIGLMQDRQNVLFLSIAACVAGVALSIVGVLKSGTGTAIGNLSAADEIIKLKALMDQGVITPEEFSTKKCQLLGS